MQSIYTLLILRHFLSIVLKTEMLYLFEFPALLKHAGISRLVMSCIVESLEGRKRESQLVSQNRNYTSQESITSPNKISDTCKKRVC